MSQTVLNWLRRLLLSGMLHMLNVKIPPVHMLPDLFWLVNRYFWHEQQIMLLRLHFAMSPTQSSHSFCEREWESSGLAAAVGTYGLATFLNLTSGPPLSTCADLVAHSVIDVEMHMMTGLAMVIKLTM